MTQDKKRSAGYKTLCPVLQPVCEWAYVALIRHDGGVYHFFRSLVAVRHDVPFAIACSTRQITLLLTFLHWGANRGSGCRGV